MQPSKKNLYLILSTITTAIVLAATIVIIAAIHSTGPYRAHLYLMAVYDFALVILLIKLRVRMGYRIPRGRLFYIHLASAIAFFVSLMTLAFWSQPDWLEYLMWTLYMTALVTGSVLFYRSTMQALLR